MKLGKTLKNEKQLVEFNAQVNCPYRLCRIYSYLSSTWPHLNSDVGLEKGEY